MLSLHILKNRGGAVLDTYHISGGRKLSGTVSAGGAKNAVLPLMAASVMADGELFSVQSSSAVRCLCHAGYS